MHSVGQCLPHCLILNLGDLQIVLKIHMWQKEIPYGAMQQG